MMLFVNGISRGVQCNNVGYWVRDHESAFEILTQLVAENWILQNATVIDGYDRMAVPIEVFDGQPIQMHIHALQVQWQQILSNPPTAPVAIIDKQHLTDWYEQLDAYYGDMLSYLERMNLLLKISKVKSKKHRDEQLRLRLDQQYESLLSSNDRMSKQTRASRRKNRRRIREIKKNR